MTCSVRAFRPRPAHGFLGSRRESGERGAGTVAAAMTVCVLAALFLGVFVLVKGASAMQRAQTAADMIALRAAQKVAEGSGATACPGQREANRYGVRFETCHIDGDKVRVEVSVAVEELGGFKIKASAVAGPAESASGEDNGLGRS